MTDLAEETQYPQVSLLCIVVNLPCVCCVHVYTVGALNSGQPRDSFKCSN